MKQFLLLYSLKLDNQAFKKTEILNQYKLKYNMKDQPYCVMQHMGTAEAF